ncbi:hypothetical protein [Guptibacillus algicola]|uniref:hypothetical protein n=1 Tax=Guptibacillus algicola TaxID=225844 RepID=UPI001CD555B9|nr:hypothetical protein [Alkalihalobacillus algicola]MCA0988430.1 hypothetical protein [Alkalihalobacillus algicola]
MKKMTIFGVSLLSFSLILSACGQTEESSSSSDPEKKVEATADESSESKESNTEEMNSDEANNTDSSEDQEDQTDDSTTEGDEEGSSNEDVSSDDTSELSYTLTEDVYTEDGVTISYPQLTNASDTAKQDEVNDLLFNEAYKVMNFYEGSEGLDLEVDYAVSYESPYFLSVQYAGSGYVEGAAHPNNLFYTTNIDLENMERIRLTDVINANESFIELFKSDAFQPVNPDHKEFEKELKENVSVTDLQNADSLDGIGTDQHSETFTYFTEDRIGINFGTSHAVGGHAAFEINYVDAPEEMWNGDKIWDLLKIYQ